MRKIFAPMIAATLALALTGCGGTQTNQAAASGQAAKDGKYAVGISQILSHPSLDASVRGFKAALADAGLNVTYYEQNAQNDQGTASSIAAKFSTQNLDLILAVATPMAQAVAGKVKDTPTLFTAVTDPEAAKLVASNEAPGGNVTGTTDMNPVAKQIDLIKQVKPSAKKLGVIYSSAEVNSEVQMKLARAEAKAQGLEITEKTVTNSSEVVQAVQALEGVDAIYVPTDNTVVSALASVIKYAESNKILVVVGEADSVSKGGALTYGLDYEILGRQTGEMAVKILKGEAKPESMPVEAQKTPQLVVNPAAAQRMGSPIPQELLDKADKTIE